MNTTRLNKDALLVAKGLGIMLVVFGHLTTRGPLPDPYGFHMPLFFFLSGMSLRSSPSIGGLVRRDGQSLLLYTLVHIAIFAAITVLIFNPAGVISIKSSSPLSWKTYFVEPLTSSSHHVQLFLVAWFLIALFFVRFACVLILKLLAKLPARFRLALQILIAVALGYIGMRFLAQKFTATQFWAWNILSQIFVGSFFCLIGHIVQNNLTIPKSLPPLWTAFGLLVIYRLLNLPAISIAFSQYPTGFLPLCLNAYLGIAMTLLASYGLQSYSWLRDIGESSKAIMSWHLTIFAGVNLVFVAIGRLVAANVGVYTSLQPARTWPIYLGLGIGLPWLLPRAFQLLREPRRIPFPFIAKEAAAPQKPEAGLPL